MAASRLSTVSDGTYSAAYGYLANSPLVSDVTFRQNSTTRMTTTKSYDYLNRLTSISSQPTGTAEAPLSFNYGQNDANQRVRVDVGDGSYWVYAYDKLGQVTSGKRYWNDGSPVAGQQFEYAFDVIGNRTATKAGGDANGANLRSATYSANNLNQYTSRTVPGAADVVGVSLTYSTTTVNSQSTERHREYFRKELAIDNSSTSVWQPIAVSSTSTNGTETVNGNIFLPKSAEQFTYDLDGNLTSDGRWTNKWDAENRLISMESLSGAPAASVRRLTFQYDWMGRRVLKAVELGTNSTWNTIVSNRFVYDGWNLIAEINATNNAVINSYIWGSDLSGSLQGAGGVGGLLAESQNGNGTHFPAYDGNGSVSALVKADDGTVTARYDYGPLGEVIRSSGERAKANPFRFSTKYQDDESDLLYYGYRYFISSAGRWLNRDPIDEAGGISLYQFNLNTPANRIDTDGRESLPTISPIGGGYYVSPFYPGRIFGGNYIPPTNPADAARNKLGGWEWYLFSPIPPNWFGKPKCNKFVGDCISECRNRPKPLVGGRYPTAGEWIDPNVTIPGFGPPHRNPEPGDVVSDGTHMGIMVSGGYIEAPTYGTIKFLPTNNPIWKPALGRSPLP